MPSLRELGNEQFKAGNYKEAEALYTQAIQHDSSDPRLLSNRAMTRLKLQDWPGAESDSQEAVERIGPDNNKSMKSYYNLAQALIGLKRPAEALEMGKKSYQMALETRDRSTEIMSQFILQAKKEIWQEKETRRLRELDSTLRLVEEMLDERKENSLRELQSQFDQGLVGQVGKDEEAAAIKEEHKMRTEQVRAAFADTSKPETQERVVPEYLIDSMTFEIMHDPVITPSGASYERASLLKYLKDHPHDPLTRDPLTESQIIPNRALRECCEAFLDQNGWAVEY
ncbi:putative u-box domain-containing protein [Phaeomoniella chlamydospora]|uniref:Putative u-box domain-containing protein n=1 Tax=Phaeomoniella chlamydospora TaxID=158046 RepID=A0A0G2E417_PHACM|nr:putative u-box domain-containing protein [Phaeomoniella chlamydospora]